MPEQTDIIEGSTAFLTTANNWPEKFARRYAKHQLFLKGKEDGARFVAKKGETLPKNLTNADLRNANLTNADMTGAVLWNADMTGAVLTGTVLTGAVLTGAVLWNADLTNADLTNADLSNTILRNADLWGAILRGAQGLTWNQLNSAADYEGARLPKYLITNPAATRTPAPS